METKLERIADKSRNEKRPIFTSLYHLINKEMLRQCHKELDGNKAEGIDNVNKKEYAENLDGVLPDKAVNFLERISEYYGAEKKRITTKDVEEFVKLFAKNKKICYKARLNLTQNENL